MKLRCIFRRRNRRDEPSVIDGLNTMSDALLARAKAQRDRVEATERRLQEIDRRLSPGGT